MTSFLYTSYICCKISDPQFASKKRKKEEALILLYFLKIQYIFLFFLIYTELVMLTKIY